MQLLVDVIGNRIEVSQGMIRMHPVISRRFVIIHEDD